MPQRGRPLFCRLWTVMSVSSFTASHRRQLSLPDFTGRELRHAEFQPPAQGHAIQWGGREFSDASRPDSEASVLENRVTARQTELTCMWGFTRHRTVATWREGRPSMAARHGSGVSVSCGHDDAV